jgi:hypothetical protein
MKSVLAAMNVSTAGIGAGRARQPNRSLDAEWLYGWTHHGTIGETVARLHKRTRALEIKDGGKWIRCFPGTDEFFTAR